MRCLEAASPPIPLRVSESGHAHAHDGHSHAEHEHGLAQYRPHATRNRRRLLLVIVLGSLILVAELVGAWASGSLVLLSDAAHAFTDVSAVLLAYVAVTFAQRPATLRKSYGFHRAEVVAAFANAILLWLLTAWFLFEAVRRLRDPPDVSGPIVTIVASATLVANLAMAWILHRGANENVNVRSAYLHVLSDALGSVAALVAGLAIQLRGWTWADPVTTIFVSGLILVWTWRLTRETLHILLEGTPERMDTDALRKDIRGVSGVLDVHDLHVWTLTTGLDSMSAHVLVADASRGPAVARAVRAAIVEKYSLGHVTLEVEDASSDCEKCH